MFLLQRSTDTYCKNLGLEPEEFRAKFQEEKRLKQEEEKKFQEHLDSLVVQKEQREREQREKVRRDSEIKSMAKEGCFTDIRRGVQSSKADQENKNLVKLRAERERFERAERNKAEGYTGGMLPQNRFVRQAEQKREDEKQRLLQSVIISNTEQAKQKTPEMSQKPSKPPRKDADDRYLVKLREQTAAFQTFTESVYLKNQHLEKEKQTEVQMEEKSKQAASELDSKYENRQKQKQHQFRTQQIPKEAAALNLTEVKKQEAIKACDEQERRAERYRAEQQAKREREREQKAQKEASIKETAAYWQTQVEHRQEQHRTEQQEKVEWYNKQCETERVMKQTDQRKAEEKKQREDQCMGINNKMVVAQNALAQHRQIQEQQARMYQAQCDSIKRDEFMENVEEQICRAKAENRIVFPLLNQQEKLMAPEDRLYASFGQDCEVVPRKKMTETHKMKNTYNFLSEEDSDQVCSNGTRCGYRTALSPMEQTPESCPHSGSRLGRSSSTIATSSESKTDVRKVEDVNSTYDHGQKQKEFQHQEAAAHHLAEFKKKETINARGDEERRAHRFMGQSEFKLQQEREKKAQKEATVKTTAAYWRSQMERRHEQKRAEQQEKADWSNKQCESERILQQEEQRKAQERRQKQEQCNEINNKMIIAKNALARRREIQMQNAQMERAQRYSKKGKLNDVEERIRRAKAENKIMLLPNGQRQTDDRLYLCADQKCEVVMRKVTPETRRIQEKIRDAHIDLSEEDSDQVCATDTRCGYRTALSPMEQTPGSCPHSGSRLGRSSSNIATYPESKTDFRKVEDVASKYDHGQKLNEFQHREAAAHHLPELKKQEAINVREDEEREKKAQNEATVKTTAAHWRSQMERRKEQKRAEAKAENKIMLSAIAQRQTDDRLYVCNGQKCEVVMRKVTPETRRIQEKIRDAHIDLSEEDSDQVCATDTRCGSRTGLSPVEQTPGSCPHSGSRLGRPSSNIATYPESKTDFRKEDDFASKYDHGQKLNEFQHREAAAHHLPELKKQEAINVREDEEREKKAQNEATVKTTAAHWRSQMERRKEQKRAEAKAENKIMLSAIAQRQTDDRLYVCNSQKCEVVMRKATPEIRRMEEKIRYAHFDLSEEVSDQVCANDTRCGSRTAKSPESHLGKSLSNIQVKSSEAKTELVLQNTVSTFTETKEEKRPSCVPWHRSSDEASKTISYQNTPRSTQIIVQRVPANRVVLQNNSNVTKKPLTLPLIVPKQASTNPKIVVLGESLTSAAKRKAEEVKLPQIQTALKPTLTSNPVQGHSPSHSQKVSNPSSLFRTSQSPVIKPPLSPNTLNFMRRRPSLPPITQNRAPASGPNSTITDSVRVIPLTATRKY